MKSCSSRTSTNVVSLLREVAVKPHDIKVAHLSIKIFCLANKRRNPMSSAHSYMGIVFISISFILVMRGSACLPRVA